MLPQCINFANSSTPTQAFVWFVWMVCSISPSTASELGWSAKGEKLAYVVCRKDQNEVVGWVWKEQEDEAAGKQVWQIWVKGERETLQQVVQSEKPLSLVDWKPDGTGLAYVEYEPGPKPSWKLWIQTEEAEPELLDQFPGAMLTEAQLNGIDKLNISGSWAASGSRLACEVDDEVRVWSLPHRRQVAHFPQASCPVFSPQSDDLAFHRHTPEGGLWVATEPYTQPRFILLTEACRTPPQWMPDGGSLVAVRARQWPNERGETERLAPAMNWEVDVVRSSVRRGELTLLHSLSPAPPAPSPFPAFAWFSLSPNAHTLHIATSHSFQSVKLQPGSPTHVWHPVIADVPFSAAVLSPTGQWMAVRWGTGASTNCVLLVDWQQESRTFLVGDFRWRIETLRQLAEQIDQRLHKLAVSTPAYSPVWLGRIPSQNTWHVEKSPESASLSQLLARARTLLDFDTESLPQETDQADWQAFHELAGYIHWLSGNSPAVAQHLAALDHCKLTPSARLLQLSLRSQLYLATGRSREAQTLLADLLRRLETAERRELPRSNSRLPSLRQALESLQVRMASQAAIPHK